MSVAVVALLIEKGRTRSHIASPELWNLTASGLRALVELLEGHIGGTDVHNGAQPHAGIERNVLLDLEVAGLHPPRIIALQCMEV